MNKALRSEARPPAIARATLLAGVPVHRGDADQGGEPAPVQVAHTLDEGLFGVGTVEPIEPHRASRKIGGQCAG